jgi:hypothetical protein
MVQNFLTNIFEKKLVVDRRCSHGIIGAIVASMESELFDFSAIWVPQPDLLTLHFNDILAAFVDFLIIEWTHSHCNLNAISHILLSIIYNFNQVLQITLIIKTHQASRTFSNYYIIISMCWNY